MEKLKLRKYQVCSFFVYLLLQALSLIPPYLMQYTIDELITDRDYFKIALLIALFIAIPLISVVLQYAFNYFFVVFARKKGNEISLDILRKIIYQKKPFLDQNNSVELVTYTSKEAVNYVYFKMIDVPRKYVSIMIASLITVLLFVYSPVIGAIQLLYIPFILFPVRRIVKTIDRDIQRILELNAKNNQTKSDIFQGIEYIKTMRLEEKKCSEVDEINAKNMKRWGKVSSLDMLSGMWSDGFATYLFTGITFSALILLYLAKIPYNVVTLGSIVSTLSYVGLLYANENAIVNLLIGGKKNEAEYRNLFEYLKLNEEEKRETELQEVTLNDEIDIRNLSFAYGEKEIFHHLSLKIKMKEWTTIVGESGCGKSTLTKLLLKLYRVEDGMIFYDGKDINRLSCFSLREKVTKLSQDTFLFPGTIRYNFELIKSGVTDDEIWKALEFASLSKFAALLPKGLDTEVGELGKLLSGGEKQRLAIALGYLRNTPVYILDETTSNIDAENKTVVLNCFKRLKEEGKTILCITHDSLLEEYSDKIISLK